MITDNRSNNVIPFDYMVQFTLTGNQSSQQILTLASDSVFELETTLGMSSLDGVTDQRPNNFSLQVTDNSTGRQLSNAKIPQRVLAGIAERSVMRRRVVQFPPASNILFDVTNLSGSANVVTILLRGMKIFQLK